jgi:hypothetical protein
VRQRTHVDLTNFSFEEFVEFLFDRDVPPEAEERNPWYRHLNVNFNAFKICAYYDRLFRGPEFLANRFTDTQLEQGFWVIQGPNLDCSVPWILSNSEIPISNREGCIRSMVFLFKNLFADRSVDDAVYMWWDSLCYDWHCGNRKRSRGGEDERLQDVFFETLSIVLSSDSETCQRAALHGLGHLHHPGTSALIERYIHEHPSLSEKWKNYALAAAKFEVM